MDARHGRAAIRILPNEYLVTGEDLLLTTVLGSCVSACLRDPVAGVGGMNHFMLPAAGPEVAGYESRSLRYGANAMDALLAGLYERGAVAERIEAKVFGGAMMIADMTHARVGEANAQFVLDYLARRGIAVRAQDLNDSCARQLHYCPRSGRARVKRLTSARLAPAELAIVAEDRAIAGRLIDELRRGENVTPRALGPGRR